MLEMAMLHNSPFLIKGDWLDQVAAHNKLIWLTEAIKDPRGYGDQIKDKINPGGRL